MLNFFRKIRYNLMSANKTGKYLKYAIGEIVLVMIGILFALQVNNWNEKRILKSEEQKMLLSLRSELEDNVIKFDSVYLIHIEKDSVIRRLIDMDPRIENFNSQDSLVNKADWCWTFNPSRGIYNSIINSGKIELIRDNNLKNKIAKLSDVIDDYLEEENFAQAYNSKHIEPLFVKLFSFYIRDRSKEERATDSINYLKVIPSKEFQNQMIFILYSMEGVFEEGPGLREEFVSIINMIDDQIQP
jgi:hypothetical protein